MTSEIAAILKSLFLPPGLNLFIVLSGLLLFRHRRRLLAYCIAASFILLYLFSIPVFSRTLAQFIEPDRVFDLSLLPDNKSTALVILGCNRYADPPEYQNDDVSECSLVRLRYAAGLIRQNGLEFPVLVSGGSVYNESESEASIMTRVLKDVFLIDVKWIGKRKVGTRSRTRNSAARFSRPRVSKILSWSHMHCI